MGDVIDQNIISGEHGTEYWNEDSVEFYANGTGDLGLTTYIDGVAQVTVPALNINRTPEDAIISGMRGTTVGARVYAAETETGYAVEMAIPLENDVWEITPEHGGVIGFQVHLNGASTFDRDTKLIWSALDTADQSYLDPSVFGRLIFFEIGQTEVRVIEPTAAPTAMPVDEDAPYRNPDLPVTERVEDLLARMTTEEKIGQMTLVEKNSIQDEDITGRYIGALLSGGGGYPTPPTRRRTGPRWWTGSRNMLWRPGWASHSSTAWTRCTGTTTWSGRWSFPTTSGWARPETPS